MSLETLRQQFPWPDERPPKRIEDKDHHGWLHDNTAAMLRKVGVGCGLILELGTWTGKTARFLCDAFPGAHVITIDHYRGSLEHQGAHHDAIRPHLYDICAYRTWAYQERVTLVKADTVAGMAVVLSEAVEPDLIYIDASHDPRSCEEDLRCAHDMFPNAKLCGDDYSSHKGTLGQMVERVAAEWGMTCNDIGKQGWYLT